MSELVKALNKARLEIKAAIFKSALNEHQGYAYVGHEAVLTSGARETLAKNGLLLMQLSVDFVSEIPAGRNKALLWRGEFVLQHDSGEEKRISLVATTQQNDKAAYVASTGLDRTAFLRVLALTGSSEDDPDHDSHDRKTQQNQHGNQQQPRKPVDPFVAEVMDKLRNATPENIEQLLNDANTLRPSLAPEEKAGMRTAAEFARARVGQILEERKMVHDMKHEEATRSAASA